MQWWCSAAAVLLQHSCSGVAALLGVGGEVGPVQFKLSAADSVATPDNPDRA
jgi:hypothetical protein